MVLKFRSAVQYGILGATAGLAFPWVMKLLAAILGFFGIGVTQATVSLTLTPPSTELAGLVAKVLKGILPIGLNQWMTIVIGAGLAGMIGAYIVDFFKQLKGTDLRKAVWSLTVGSIIAVIITSLSVPAAIIPMVVSTALGAVVISWIYIKVLGKMKFFAIPG